MVLREMGRDSEAEHCAMLETVLQDKELPQMPIAPLLRRHVTDHIAGCMILVVEFFTELGFQLPGVVPDLGLFDA